MAGDTVSDDFDDAPTVIRLPLLPGPNDIADTLERRRRIEEELAGQARAAVQTVAETAAALGTMSDQLDQAVKHARAAGAPWSEIGRAVGISRQAAQQRWSEQ